MIIVAPIIFSFVAVLLVLRGVATAPWQGLSALLFTSASVAFYYMTPGKSCRRCLGNWMYCDCLMSAFLGFRNHDADLESSEDLNYLILEGSPHAEEEHTTVAEG